MNTNIDLLFLGGVFPLHKMREVLDNSHDNVQMAANNFQWSLINGFEENLNKPVTLINEMFIGTFPQHYKKCFIPEEKFSHVPGACDINLGFFNLAYVKHFLKPRHEKKYVRKWADSHNHGWVFIYALSKRTIRLAKEIKKHHPHMPIICSVNDLPIHIMKDRKGLMVAAYKQYQQWIVNNGLKSIDGFVLVAERQIDKLRVDRNACILVEAITETQNEAFVPITTNTKKRIVYAGTLSYQYNILNLVNAFCQVHFQDAELVICGCGDAADSIRQAAQKDSRIKYLGVISKKETMELMKSARVLVNPRFKGQEFTNYSFPIKTIEYLLSGRPVVCQKLEAIPSEYDDHLIYFEDSDGDAELARILENILSLTIEEVNYIGKKNFDFVVNQKSEKVQASRILKLFQDLATK